MGIGGARGGAARKGSGLARLCSIKGEWSNMSLILDLHTHVTPQSFPNAVSEAALHRWPCMRCSAETNMLTIGETPFRKLDDRSWSAARRLEDMAREGVALQLLSPMPELLSYWLPVADADRLCDHVNDQIAAMVAEAPGQFRGIGALPLQDIPLAISRLRRLMERFGLVGIEIGSNINGLMLGDPAFEPLWEAVAAERMAVFVHALHPVTAKILPPDKLFTAFALFPMDVALAAASMIKAGIFDRFPTLRVAFSHGGGALGSILGRLDTGWSRSEGFGGKVSRPPSTIAKSLFYDSNVYDQPYLAHLVKNMAPGRVFTGSDYPYDIMQPDLQDYLGGAGLNNGELASLGVGAAADFLQEDFRTLSSALG